MYVDSGADLTLISRRIAKLIGLDLSLNRHQLTGLTGHPLTVSIHKVHIKIGETIMETDVAAALREDVPHLLGRAGIFNNYKITFKEYDLVTSFDHPRK
jgi:hypothetical protein